MLHTDHSVISERIRFWFVQIVWVHQVCVSLTIKLILVLCRFRNASTVTYSLWKLEAFKVLDVGFVSYLWSLFSISSLHYAHIMTGSWRCTNFHLLYAWTNFRRLWLLETVVGSGALVRVTHLVVRANYLLWTLRPTHRIGVSASAVPITLRYASLHVSLCFFFGLWVLSSIGICTV